MYSREPRLSTVKRRKPESCNNNIDAGKNYVPVNRFSKKYIQQDEALKGTWVKYERTGDWKTLCGSMVPTA